MKDPARLRWVNRGLGGAFVAAGLALASFRRAARGVRLTLPNNKESDMTIKVGDRLPEGTVQEFIEVEGNGCTVGPNTFKVRGPREGQEDRDLRRCRAPSRPPARPSTCPSYLGNLDALKAKGVDEVWCFAVNDAFVMGAWARDQKAGGKIRFMADGSADYTKKLGLELDLIARGLGVRCQRFSMLVDDGVVKSLNVEAPGKFEVSDGETMLKQL